jgi:hypothetical protein
MVCFALILQPLHNICWKCIIQHYSAWTPLKNPFAISA